MPRVVFPPPVPSCVREAVARQATSKYKSLEVANKHGYALLTDMNGVECIDMPGMGAMGVHYVNGSLVGDAVLDTRRPEALVYEQRGGNLHLVALEYIVFQSVWEEAGNQDPPRLFGREFDFVDEPNRYGLPPFYALHAWAWKGNPSGDFFAWNPRVDC